MTKKEFSEEPSLNGTIDPGPFFLYGFIRFPSKRLPRLDLIKDFKVIPDGPPYP